MNSSPQGRPIQRPRGRRNPLLRRDFSGSGKTREQGAAEGREGAKSRVRPRPPLPKTRQHGAAPENAFTVAPESAQDVSTARSVPNNGGSGAAEPQAKKLILQGGLAPNFYPPQSTNCGRPTRSRSCCPSTGGDHAGSIDAVCPLDGESVAHDIVATNLSLKLWRELAETWIGAASGWWGLAPQSQEKGPRTESDRRFDAPEWEQHPFFRLLKQSYLAISDQLLEEACRDTLDPAERL